MDSAQASIAFKKLTIETDGTAKGTTIKLNGDAIADLGYLSMTFWNDGLSNPVSLGFTTKDPNPSPGTLVQQSYFSLMCPKDDDDADASKASTAPKASASLVKQKALPTHALPRGNARRSLYAKL